MSKIREIFPNIDQVIEIIDEENETTIKGKTSEYDKDGDVAYGHETILEVTETGIKVDTKYISVSLFGEVGEVGMMTCNLYSKELPFDSNAFEEFKNFVEHGWDLKECMGKPEKTIRIPNLIALAK
jgi:hypothetical protein